MNRRRRAFTIVEIMVCAALVAIVFAAVNSGLFTGRKAAEKGLNYLDRLGKINRLLEHCKRAVRFATQITPQHGPGAARSYVIKYIEKVEAPGLTRVEKEMRIKAKPVKKGTKVTIKYKNKKTTYQLNDLEFFMELDKNLATIALSPTKGNRPPIALSLFAPFLNQVSLPPMAGVTGTTFPPPLGTATNTVPPLNQSTTQPLNTSNGTNNTSNVGTMNSPNGATIKTHTNNSQDPANDTGTDMLGTSSTFGGGRTDRNNQEVDGVNIGDIQFTTMNATHNPNSRTGTRPGTRSGTRSGTGNRPGASPGTLMGAGNPLDGQSTNPTDGQSNNESNPPAQPPAQDEVLGMDGWSNSLGNQITATSLQNADRPPADEEKEDEDEPQEETDRRRRPPVRTQPIVPEDGEASEVQLYGDSSFGDFDFDNPFGS